MTENIEFDQAITDGMIVEMCRHRTGCAVVRRMLNRREMMYIHLSGHNHDPAGMLACRLFDPGAATHQAVGIGFGAG